MPFPPLTKQQWTEELELAISGLGKASHWRVTKATVEQTSPLCHAELADTRVGKVRSVVVARDRFGTAGARIEEITRQIQTGVEPQWHDSARRDGAVRDRDP
jgi:hypothetical protein